MQTELYAIPKRLLLCAQRYLFRMVTIGVDGDGHRLLRLQCLHSDFVTAKEQRVHHVRAVLRSVVVVFQFAIST